MTIKVQVGARLERNLILNVAEAEYNVTLLGAFLQCVQYEPSMQRVYSMIASICNVTGALMYVLLD